MAFLTEESQTDEEKKEQAGQDIVSSAQSSTIDGGSVSTPAQQQTQRTGGGGGSGQFTNIQQYIEANRPKTQQLAKDITSGVQQEATQLGKSLQQQRAQTIGQEGQYGAGQQEFIQKQIEQAKAGKQASEEDIAKFRQISTDAQKAPDLSKQRQQASELERRGREFETSRGRFEGLQRLVGKQSPTYTTGQRQLDQLLLAGDRPSRLQSVRNIRQATKGLGERVGQLQTDIQQARQSRLQEAGAVQQEREAALGDIRGLQERIQQGRTEQGGFQLSQEDLQRIGLGEGVQELYGIDPTSYLESGATSQDIARLGALSKLAGVESGAELREFDPSALQEAVQEAKGRYESQLGNIQGSRFFDYGRMASSEAGRRDMVQEALKYYGGDPAALSRAHSQFRATGGSEQQFLNMLESRRQQRLSQELAQQFNLGQGITGI